MISEKMINALNEQVNAELHASYLYLSMVAYFESENLPGFAGWMKAQAQEEIGHAMKIFGHVNERGGRVTLKAIDKPAETWDSPADAFEAALNHEKKVTGLINDLVDLAISEKDHATNSFLQWFVDEQVEEEMSVGDVLEKVKMASKAPHAMLMVDRELGARGGAAEAH